MRLIMILLLLLPLALSAVVYTNTLNTPYGSLNYTIVNGSTIDLDGQFAVVETINEPTGLWFRLNCSNGDTNCETEVQKKYRLLLKLDNNPYNFSLNQSCLTPIVFIENTTSYNSKVFITKPEQGIYYAICPKRYLDRVVATKSCGYYMPLFTFWDITNSTRISLESVINNSYEEYPFVFCVYPAKDQLIFIPTTEVVLTTLYPFADINIILKNFDSKPVNVTLTYNTDQNALNASYFIYNNTASNIVNLTLPAAEEEPGKVSIIFRVSSIEAVNGTIYFKLYKENNTLVDTKVLRVKVITTEGKYQKAGAEINLGLFLFIIYLISRALRPKIL